jgi:hypothetical protein
MHRKIRKYKIELRKDAIIIKKLRTETTQKGNKLSKKETKRLKHSKQVIAPEPSYPEATPKKPKGRNHNNQSRQT